MFKLVRKIAVVLLSVPFVLVGCTSAPGKSDRYLKADPSVVSGTFDNGLSYYVQHNEEPKNRISIRLVVGVGSNAEEDDQKGVAHLIEHMAFNGSEHFKENELVSYFESIGMNFGADLNAYTSFDETVYMLEVPADDPAMLATGMQVVRDWACALSFDSVELDKERGVVTEEWRLGRGLSGRLQDQYIPFLLRNSRYAERLPIGDMDVISSVSRQRVVDFYEKWYRPELMSVVLVGDASVEVLEQAVRTAMEDIPASKNRITRPKYSVPLAKEQDMLFLHDSEISYPWFAIVSPKEDMTLFTSDDVREWLIYSIATSIFDERLSTLVNYVDCPWLSLSTVSMSIAPGSMFEGLSFVPKEGQFDRAFCYMLDEYERIRRYGVLDSEFNRQIAVRKADVKHWYETRDLITSYSKASDIVSYILTGSPMLSPDDLYTLYTEAIASITIKDVNKALSQFLPSRGNFLLAEVPDNAIDIPTKEEIEDLWRNYTPKDLDDFEDDVAESDFGSRPSSMADIVATDHVKELDANIYILDNGVRFITKKTKFSRDEINMTAWSDGGMALVADEDIPSAYESVDYAISSGINGMSYNQLVKSLAGVHASLSLQINNFSESITGSSSRNDFECMLQLMTQFFADPQFTKSGWDAMMPNIVKSASTFGSSPEEVFTDKIREVLFGDNAHYPRHDLSFVEKMNRETAEKVYRDRFSNAADFTFIFVGDFDEDTLVELCRYYLGNLPANDDREVVLHTAPAFPKGKTNASVKKGSDPQSQVFIAFGGSVPPSTSPNEDYLDSHLTGAVESLLEMKLREVLREDKSGTYGVSVYVGLDGFRVGDPRQYSVQISFGCEPSRAEQLTNETIAVIKELQSKPAPEEYVNKIKESVRRGMENLDRNNDWWVNVIMATIVVGYQDIDTVGDAEFIASAITGEKLTELVRTYCNTDNYATVILYPED